MIEQLIQQDQELFLFLNGLGTETWDAFWMAYTHKYNWIPFYAILVYLMFKKYNTKAFILTLILVAFLVTFTDQVTNLFKSGFARPRPCHQEGVIEYMRLVKSYCGGAYGFFSGHSSNAMAVAIFVGCMLKYKYKYAIYLLVVWAILMAYSRIYIGVHYPLDITCGALFGALSGYLFFKLNNYVHHRFTLIKKTG